MRVIISIIFALFFASFANAADFTLKSKSFTNNQPIPPRYSCDDKNLSPHLKWENPPDDIHHHYVFTVYALDAMLDLEPGVNVDDLTNKVQSHILKQTQLTGVYSH